MRRCSVGRRDAVQVTLEVIARMRQLEPRLLVTWEPGWETRGNGTTANYDFASVHHTASNTSLAKPFPTQSLLRDGRSDLSGPLCNEACPACTVEQPRIHVMAANPANHAGASRASGPVPKLALFNPRTRGLEIDYAGSVAMLAGQLYVAHIWTRANADVLAGGNVEHVRAHAETSVTGKWDPGYAPGKTIDMAAFRQNAAALTVQEIDMPVTEAEIDRIADRVWQRGQSHGDWKNIPPIIFLADNRTIVGEAMLNTRQLLGKPGVDVDEKALAESLAPLLPTMVSGAVSTLPGEQLRELAKYINDEQDRRSRDGDPTTGPVS